MTVAKKKGVGRPQEAVRWTVNLASSEFGCDRKTVTKLLRETDAEPGADGKFSTSQIIRALFKEKPQDRLALKRIEQIDLEMEISRKERIAIEVLNNVNDEVYQSAAALLKSHSGKVLSEEVINDIYALFRSIPEKLKWTT